MPLVIILPILTLFLFLLLTERVTVRYYNLDEPTVDLGFTIFAISFKKSKDRDNKKEDGPDRKAVRAAFNYLFGHGDTVISTLKIPISATDPASFFISRGILSSLISVSLATIKHKARNLEINDINFYQSDNNNFKITVDVRVIIPLFNFLVGLLIFARHNYSVRKRDKKCRSLK